MHNNNLKPGQIATSLIPAEFKLVACDGKKRPYQRQWQKRPLDAAGIASEMRGRHCKAVGVLCGEPSGGLLFLDHDGASCDALIEELAGAPLAEALPKTFTVFSGKPGRAQHVYRIPQIFWGAIATHKVPTGAVGPNGKPEQLEFRWNGGQSIIQGAHPETEGYRWQGTPEDIVEAPLWMVTQMLVESVPDEVPALAQAPMSDTDWALSYLSAIPPTEDYDTWLHVGMALHSVSDTLLSAWDDWSRPAANYNEKDCERKWRSFRRSGRGIGTLGHLAKKHGWQSVSVAVAAQCQSRTDVSKPSNSKGSGAVSAVSVKTESNLLLEESLITDQEWIRFQTGMKSPGSFDPFLWLPERLAKLARTDAAHNCIDPMALWAYLFPSVLSLMGRDTLLDMGNWQTPNIAWSLLIGESGTGKSRAKSLVLGPLERWNIRAFEDWKIRVEDWQQQEKAKAKDKSDDVKPDPRPKCRRYLISQSTPEGIVRRLADQEDNGVLGYRDEFAGFIKGLTQYTSGKGDGMEMLLETWDGGSILVDRADEDKSFAVESSRLSLVGGIQPGVFNKVFETAEDAQGTLARFLCVVPSELVYKRHRGANVLPAELSKLYRFIDTTRWGTIVPTEDADDLFTEIAEDFNNQTAPTKNAQPWVRKLAGQTLRLAMAIHAIECFYSQGKRLDTLTADTLSRAYHMATHYQRHMLALMNLSASDGVEGILTKIQTVACSTAGGVSARDIARGAAGSRVGALARNEGMKPAAFCHGLFRELASKGWGEVRETVAANGKIVITYHAFSDHCQKNTDTADTAPQSLEHQGLKATDTVSTLTDTVTDTDSGYSLKDTRDKGSEELVDNNGFTDTVTATAPLGAQEPPGAIAEVTPAPVAENPPIPVGSAVRIRYPDMDDKEIEENVAMYGWLPQGTECFVTKIEYEYNDFMDQYYWMADVLSPDSSKPFHVGAASLEVIEQ